MNLYQANRYLYHCSGLVVRAFASWAGGRVGSMHGHDRPKSLKLVVVAFPFVSQVCGKSAMTGLPVS